MLDRMAIGILFWNTVRKLCLTLHAGLHALLYATYREARDQWDDVTAWLRPYYWMLEDQFLMMIVMGQLVL